MTVNETHDPSLRSWIDSANLPGCDFPIQNLPFAEFRRAGSDEPYRGGVAIGDRILDLAALRSRSLFEPSAQDALAACSEPTLNRFMSMGRDAASRLRGCLSAALRSEAACAATLQADLVAQADAEFALPASIGDYTDFYSSIHHATTVGRQLRPDNPLLPNYRWIPIAYHGRSSSIGVSGQQFHRPVGQRLPKGALTPVFGPSRRLDFELEVGIFIGAGNAIGTAIPIQDAERHVFGLCLLNDWSARDIHAWGNQWPGPFLSEFLAVIRYRLTQRGKIASSSPQRRNARFSRRRRRGNSPRILRKRRLSPHHPSRRVPRNDPARRHPQLTALSSKRDSLLRGDRTRAGRAWKSVTMLRESNQ